MRHPQRRRLPALRKLRVERPEMPRRRHRVVVTHRRPEHAAAAPAAFAVQRAVPATSRAEPRTGIGACCCCCCGRRRRRSRRFHRSQSEQHQQPMADTRREASTRAQDPEVATRQSLPGPRYVPVVDPGRAQPRPPQRQRRRRNRGRSRPPARDSQGHPRAARRRQGVHGPRDHGRGSARESVPRPPLLGPQLGVD